MAVLMREILTDRGKLACTLLTLCLCCAGTGWSSQPGAPEDLADMSLEQLMQIEVTSVSRKEQKLSRAAAAIYVITQEDIRRSGLTSIPELLRMAPGLHVAQIDGNKWAITSRGFNGRFADKMLVLIDGRSIYSPIFSGVYWEMHDLMLEDVERIEVIRGPGATMWGANAVNGVINVITKSAKDTQGGMMTSGGGNVERGFGGFRYGGKIGSKLHYRVYTKYLQQDELVTSDGQPAGDNWHRGRSGMRMDWELSGKDSLTVLMGVSNGEFNHVTRLPTLAPPALLIEQQKFGASSASALARWTHEHTNGSSSALQFYYDHYDRQDPIIGEQRDTADFEFQNRFALASRHELTWGLGYRYSTDSTVANPYFYLSPASRGIQIYSGFLQDEIRLSGDKLLLTLGSKLEHNGFSGVEVQPTARLLWEPAKTHTLWTAVSRAVRTPSRGDHDGTSWVASAPGSPQTLGLPTVVNFTGNSGYQPQTLMAIEAGYRNQPHPRVSFDVAGFYNFYRNLRVIEPGIPSFVFEPAPHIEVPYYTSNGLKGTTWGAELVAQWEPADFWKLAGTYSLLHLNLESTVNHFVVFGETQQIPNHQFSLRSYLDLPGALQLDNTVYFTDRLRALASGYFSWPGIPSRLRFDTRLAWQVKRNLELSVTGQNLLDPRHPEFNPEVFTQRSEVRRGVYGKVTWRF